jgi:hypothetical protein
MPCQQLVHLMFIGIFLIASEIGELLGIYQEYPDKSVVNQGEEFLIAAPKKVIMILYQEFSQADDG